MGGFTLNIESADAFKGLEGLPKAAKPNEGDSVGGRWCEVQSGGPGMHGRDACATRT